MAAAQMTAAMRLFVEAESLLDAGDVSSGRRRLCEAFALAPALDADPWPQWAEDLYRDGPDGGGWRPVPLIGEKGGLEGLGEDLASAIVDQLRSANFAIVDDFVSAEASAQVRAACSELFETAQMHPPAQR